MSPKLIFVLTIPLLVSLANGSPQKRQQSASCRAKYSEAKGCLNSMLQKMRQGITLLREDRLGKFMGVARSIQKDEPYCRKFGEQYEDCCAAEYDCSMMEAEKQAVETEVRALGEELKNEADKAALRARQRMNPHK